MPRTAQGNRNEPAGDRPRDLAGMANASMDLHGHESGASLPYRMAACDGAHGAGVGLVLPSLASASAHSLPPQRFAVGSGVNQAIRQIGSVLGVSVVVVLVGSARGVEALANFFNLFLFLTLAGFVTALLSIAIDTHAVKPTSRAFV